MLGIIIGIAAIIAIVSTITGTNEEIKNKLVGSGNNTVEISLQQGGYGVTFDNYSTIPWGVPTVTQATKDKILELDEVEAVTTYTTRTVYSGISYKNTVLSSAEIRGIDNTYFSTCNYVIKSGRGFLEDDFKLFRKVMVVNQTAADNMFANENPLGKTVEISGVPFTVVGVADEASGFQPEINSIDEYYTYASDSSGLLFIPKAAWPIIYTYDEPENVVIKAASTDEMTRAGQQAEKILTATITNTESNYKYKAEDLLEQARSLQEMSNATNTQLIWIAGISLLVGGIGVMNIMLVSVTERTNEIGLKKAIGAKKSTILGQFLTEAAVLTSMGGLLGVASGVGAAQVIHRISGVAVGISIPAAVIAVVFSTVIGIVFGFLPSNSGS